MSGTPGSKQGSKSRNVRGRVRVNAHDIETAFGHSTQASSKTEIMGTIEINTPVVGFVPNTKEEGVWFMKV